MWDSLCQFTDLEQFKLLFFYRQVKGRFHESSLSNTHMKKKLLCTLTLKSWSTFQRSVCLLRMLIEDMQGHSWKIWKRSGRQLSWTSYILVSNQNVIKQYYFKSNRLNKNDVTWPIISSYFYKLCKLVKRNLKPV